MNFDHDFFQVSKQSEDQKKRRSLVIIEEFIQVKTTKMLQTSSSAQMQTKVKLLGVCRYRP